MSVLGALHPQIVHFAIALLVVGVAFRGLSLLRRPAFFAPAAFVLLLLGTIAAMVAVSSGDAAHGPVERVPGARPAVEDHEEWGERTRTVFIGVMIIELLGLALARSPRRRTAEIASFLVGLVGVFCLYQTGEAGGRLVYSYAGGVGIRSGDPKDVDRLLLAGMYARAMQDRKEGHSGPAAALFDDMGRRFGGDQDVALLAAESLLVDQKNPMAALTALRAIEPARTNRGLRIRHGLLTADALEAAGQREGAVAVVQALLTDIPNAPQLQQRLEKLLKARP